MIRIGRLLRFCNKLKYMQMCPLQWKVSAMRRHFYTDAKTYKWSKYLVKYAGKWRLFYVRISVIRIFYSRLKTTIKTNWENRKNFVLQISIREIRFHFNKHKPGWTGVLNERNTGFIFPALMSFSRASCATFQLVWLQNTKSFIRKSNFFLL